MVPALLWELTLDLRTHSGRGPWSDLGRVTHPRGLSVILCVVLAGGHVCTNPGVSWALLLSQSGVLVPIAMQP